MVREDRFYAFIIAHTSRSRSRIQRIRIEKKTVTTAIAIAAVANSRLVIWLLWVNATGGSSAHCV